MGVSESPMTAPGAARCRTNRIADLHKERPCSVQEGGPPERASLLVRSRLLLHGWLIKQKQYSSTPPEPSPGARKCSLSTIWLCPPTKGL